MPELTNLHKTDIIQYISIGCLTKIGGKSTYIPGFCGSNE